MSAPADAAGLRQGLHGIWRLWRVLSGDEAYERYCAHQRAHHALEPLLSRRAFFADATRRRWSGVSRCC